jgi:hypothetical protein
MTIGSIHVDREFFDAVASVGSSRIRTAFGTYWQFALRALDVVYALGSFGAIGALPSLLKLVAQSAGYKALRAAGQRYVAR